MQKGNTSTQNYYMVSKGSITHKKCLPLCFLTPPHDDFKTLSTSLLLPAP